MVDIVSEAKGGRTIRRISASFRLPSFLPRSPEQVAPSDASLHRHDESERAIRVYLEIQEDKAAGIAVYRLVEAGTGAVIQEWSGNQLTELRKFLHENHIQLIDRRV